MIDLDTLVTVVSGLSDRIMEEKYPEGPYSKEQMRDALMLMATIVLDLVADSQLTFQALKAVES